MSPFPLNNESQQEPDYILAAKSAIKFLVDSAPKIYNLFSNVSLFFIFFLYYL